MRSVAGLSAHQLEEALRQELKQEVDEFIGVHRVEWLKESLLQAAPHNVVNANKPDALFSINDGQN